MADIMDPTRLRLGNYAVRWNSAFLGSAKTVKPDVKFRTKEKKLGALGDLPIGDWIIGLDAKITVEFQEIDLTLLRSLMPWYTSGNVPLTPATWHKDLYDYAQALILHPTDVAYSTVTQDIVFSKAVPMYNFMQRDGENQDVVTVEFKIYPDRSQLTDANAPVLVFGTYGNA